MIMAFSKQQPKRTLKTIIRELVDRTNSDTARIRVLEQEMGSIKSRNDSLEQIISNQKKQSDKIIAGLSARLEKSNKRSLQIESTIKEMIKEIKKLATTSKIKELETLVDIYNPLKSQFITKEEAERMIERRLDARGETAGKKGV
jgi:predicted  nucleic acid-binding Zn-ribbon protein